MENIKSNTQKFLLTHFNPKGLSQMNHKIVSLLCHFYNNLLIFRSNLNKIMNLYQQSYKAQGFHHRQRK